MASRYVAGTRLEDALAGTQRFAELASSIVDASVSDPVQADRVADRFVELARTHADRTSDRHHLGSSVGTKHSENWSWSVSTAETRRLLRISSSRLVCTV